MAFYGWSNSGALKGAGIGGLAAGPLGGVVGGVAGGMIGGSQDKPNWVMGVYDPLYAGKLKKAADWSPNAADAFQPWETQLAGEMMPTDQNPAVSRWAQAIRQKLGALYGPNSAKTAAGVQRARAAGNVAISKLSPSWYERMMQQALSMQEDRNKIDTTSADAAFLQGFMGGGGAQGVGGLLGGV